jgi:hypothetical protein
MTSVSPISVLVHNKLTVIADDSYMQRIQKQLGHSYTASPVFSLSSIISNPHVNIYGNEPLYPKMTESEQIEWRMKHWGVAYEVENVRVELALKTRWVIRFKSRNQGPTKALATLSQKYREATFQNITYGNDGSGSSTSYLCGLSPPPNHWGPSTSHKEFQSVAGEDSCDCNYMINPRGLYPYIDCNRPEISTDQALDEFEKSSSLV